MRQLPPLFLVTLLAGAAPALAEENVLLDYRDTAFTAGQPFYSQAERRRLAALLAKASPEAAREFGDGFALLGDAEGTFGAGKGRVYLIQGAAPAAIDPFPEGLAPALLVVSEGRPSEVFRLPPDVQYQRLVAAADADGDGRDEVFLETSFTNMGQTATSLDVIALGREGKAEKAQTLAEVAFEGCDNPQGERRRSASTISAAARGLTAKAYDLPCP